jgi:Flagellar biosynthesis protein, FliO
MSAKSIAAPFPPLVEASPLAVRLRRVLRLLAQRIFPAKSSAERALAVEDRIALGPKKALIVVRCHGQRFLIATSGDMIGPVVEVAAPQSIPKSARRSRSTPNQKREA